MPSADEILVSIERRLIVVRSEIRSLKAARTALRRQGASRSKARPTGAVTESHRSEAPGRERGGDTGTPASTPPRRAVAVTPITAKPGSAQARPARKRPRSNSGSVLRADGVEAVLRETPDGLSATAIAQRTNARHAHVRDLLRELERKSQVRRTGVGRGTRWRIITDEERIAERAAELAQMSSAAS